MFCKTASSCNIVLLVLIIVKGMMLAPLYNSTVIYFPVHVIIPLELERILSFTHAMIKKSNRFECNFFDLNVITIRKPFYFVIIENNTIRCKKCNLFSKHCKITLRRITSLRRPTICSNNYVKKTNKETNHHQKNILHVRVNNHDKAKHKLGKR